MKGKISRILRVGLALVLALSLSLVMAVPVAAAVGEADVELSTNLAVAEDVQYTISFDIGASLAIGNTITLTFSGAYTIPETFANNDVTVDGTGILGASVVGNNTNKTIIITLPMAISTDTNPVVVVLTSAANLDNPVAGTYTIGVATQVETQVASKEYIISALPTVTDVQPNSGNVDDTMWVEVTGTDFTEDTTSFDFGPGVEVVADSYHWIDAYSVDCQVTITGYGAARDVVARTLAGTSVVNASTDDNFTPNPADTPQVDVWDTYTPVVDLAADTWSAATLAMTAEVQTSITDGVGEATVDGTLIVHAATYEETVVIGTSLTLESLDGADSTIIDGGSALQIVWVNAANVTIDGFTIKGDATTLNQRGILVSGATVSGFAIKNNKLVDIANDNLKVWSDAGAITSGTINKNTLTGLGADAQRACILVESINNAANGISGIEITDNTISNFLGVDDCEWPGIQVSEVGDGDVSNITITGNTISNGATGIKLTGGITGLTGDYTIADNTISGMFEGGVSADKGSDDVAPAFDLANNTITGCRYGIELGCSVANHTIKYNDISGNSWGLLVPESEGTVDAKYNWWGDISGPSSGSQLTPVFSWWSEVVSTALGSGDAMSSNVDTYDPWLTEPQATVIASGKRSYGSDAISLEKGWNTLSVPCGLKGSADEFGEIEDMGDFLTDFVGGYWYDASAGNWVLIDDSTTLEPGKGFCIQMSAASRFPVLYFDGMLDLPAYGMYAGWNLIGSMFGIDSDDWGVAAIDLDRSGEGYMFPVDALDSIKTSGSVIISPSVPGQKAKWATTVSHTGPNKMLVGEGYWVFMTANGTLAGFEVTPFCFEPGTMP